MANIQKWTRIAKLEGRPVFIHIQWDGSELSISGVEGPNANGDCLGSCGQITLGGEHHTDRIPEYDRIAEVWAAWHLNDMRPGCEHQRAEGWASRPIDPSKPTSAYGLHFEGQRQASWNMLAWVRRDEHPEGLLSHPCPECGYRYGTRWLREDVPDDVIAFLAALPDHSASVPTAWLR